MWWVWKLWLMNSAFPGLSLLNGFASLAFTISPDFCSISISLPFKWSSSIRLFLSFVSNSLVLFHWKSLHEIFSWVCLISVSTRVHTLIINFYNTYCKFLTFYDVLPFPLPEKSKEFDCLFSLMVEDLKISHYFEYCISNH